MMDSEENDLLWPVISWQFDISLVCTFWEYVEFLFPLEFFSPSISSLADVLKELDDAYERYRRETDSLQRRKLQLSIQRALIRSQELGDEKIQIAGQMVRKERPAAAPPLTGKLPGLSVCSCACAEKCFPGTFVLRNSTLSK